MKRFIIIKDWIRNNVDERLAAVVLINVLFGAYFLFLNCNTGLYLDDYGYMFVFARGQKLTTERVASLCDVLRSQYAHYFLMNGRSVAHTLLQIALIGGRGLFNAVNTIAYLCFGLAGYILIKPRTGHSPLAQLGVYLLPWLLFPEYGLVHLLACCAANYMWTMTLIMLFLIPFRLLFDGCDIFGRRKLVGAIVMAFGGIVAGWSSENGSSAAMFLVGCMGLYYLIARKRIPAWCLTGFGGAMAGFVLLLCSPGYAIRMEGLQQINMKTGVYSRFVDVLIDHTLPYFWYILAAVLCAGFLVYCSSHTETRERLRFFGGCCGVAGCVWLLLLAFSGLFAKQPAFIAYYAEFQLLLLSAVGTAFAVLLYKNTGAIRKLIVPLMLMATGLVANLAMLATPTFQTRSEWQFFVFFTLGAVWVFDRTVCELLALIPIKDYAVWTRRGVLAALLVLSVVSLTIVAVKTDRYYEYYVAREEYIERCVAAGELNVGLTALPEPDDRRIYGRDIANTDPEYWVNQAMRQYYGLRSIRII